MASGYAKRLEENRRNRKLCHLNPFEFFDHSPTDPSCSRYRPLALGLQSTCGPPPSALHLGRTPCRAPLRRRADGASGSKGWGANEEIGVEVFKIAYARSSFAIRR